MTDIVERLRDVAIETDCDAVANDAIAEIERLRAMLRRIANNPNLSALDFEQIRKAIGND